MASLEDDQRLDPGGEILPLLVGPGHVGNKRSLLAPAGIDHEGQMRGQRIPIVDCDERGKVEPIHQVVQDDTVGDFEVFGGVQSAPL